MEWTEDELNRLDREDEVRIAGLRPDGTLRKRVIVWAVRHGDDLYVRSVYGREAAWFRGVQVRHEGHLQGGGVDKDVTFVDVDGDLQSALDAAYRTKYRRYAKSIVDSIVSPTARAATLKLVPRGEPA